MALLVLLAVVPAIAIEVSHKKQYSMRERTTTSIACCSFASVVKLVVLLVP